MRFCFQLSCRLLLFGFLTFAVWAPLGAQVGIGTNTPNPNAVLDLTTTDKGLLLPRLTTAQRSALGSALGIDDKGMTVYDSTGLELLVWDGLQWVSVSAAGLSSAANGLINNAGTVELGGILSQATQIDQSGHPLSFTGGSVGVGTSNPAYPLDVNGTINFTNELRVNGDPGAAGQVLVSDGPGLPATWGTLPASVTAADNGLSLSGSTVELGGSLYQPTIIDQAGNAFSFQNGDLGVGTGPVANVRLAVAAGTNTTGVLVNSSVASGTGIQATVTGNGSYGVVGRNENTNSTSAGVYGLLPSTNSSGAAVWGRILNGGAHSAALYGTNNGGTNQVYGVHGFVEGTGPKTTGVFGENWGLSSIQYGVLGNVRSITDSTAGVHGLATGTSGQTFGVYGLSNSSTNNAAGVLGLANASSGIVYGVLGRTNSTSGTAAGVMGTTSTNAVGVRALSTGAGPAAQALQSGVKTTEANAMLVTNQSTTTTAGLLKRGLYIQNTGTWAGAGSQNIGLEVDVSGGTTNYAALFTGGNVGIGTSTPNHPLHVAGGAASFGIFAINTATTGYAINGSNTGTSGTGVYGENSSNGNGVWGFAGSSTSAKGVRGTANGTGDALYAENLGTANGRAFYAIQSGTRTADANAAVISNTATGSTASTIKRGLFISTTNTWNGAGSANIGLEVSASGGLNNYAAIFSNGSVGVGTSTPAFPLDVNGVINSATGFRVNTLAPNGTYLRGNGTNYVSSGILASDLPLGLGETWQRSGTNVTLINPADFVGINVAIPSYPLEINAGTNFRGISLTHGTGSGTTGIHVSSTFDDNIGIFAVSTGINSTSIIGENLDDGTGVVGYSQTGSGVAGHSDSGPGMSATSNTGPGVMGASNSGPGLSGQNFANGLALLATKTGARTVTNTTARIENLNTSGTASIDKYGLQLHSTGIWNGTDSRNYGLWVNAAGGTHNHAAVFLGGNVGISTNQPHAQLTIEGPSIGAPGNASGTNGNNFITTSSVFTIQRGAILRPNITTSQARVVSTTTTGNSFPITTNLTATFGAQPYTVFPALMEVLDHSFNSAFYVQGLTRKIGIGTIDPLRQLSIVTDNGEAMEIRTPATVGTFSYLINTSTGGRSFMIGSLGQAAAEGTGKFMIRPETGAAGSGFYMDGLSSRIGISVTNPSANLDVFNELHIRRNNVGNADLIFNNNNPTVTRGSRWQLTARDSASQGGVFMLANYPNGTFTPRMVADTSGSFAFANTVTNPTARVSMYDNRNFSKSTLYVEAIQNTTVTDYSNEGIRAVGRGHASVAYGFAVGANLTAVSQNSWRHVGTIISISPTYGDLTDYTKLNTTPFPNSALFVTGRNLAPAILADSGDVIFNVSQRGYNFMVRGTGATTNLLRVDPMTNQVGVAVTTPLARLHVGTASGNNFAATNRYFNVGGGLLTDLAAAPTSIRADGNIWSNGGAFIASSDARIKRQLDVSDAEADLATLRQVEIRDYGFIDTVQKGHEVVKGVIAQQVAQVYPQAITRLPDVVPNIYAHAESIVLDCETQELVLTLPTGTQLPAEVEQGVQLRLITPTSEELYAVRGVNGQTIRIPWNDTDAEPAQAFVYGTLVDDFHVVDYDRLHTLGISAIQALADRSDAQAQRIQTLEADNALLRQELETLRTQQQTAQTDMASRLSQLEAQLGLLLGTQASRD